MTGSHVDQSTPPQRPVLKLTLSLLTDLVPQYHAALEAKNTLAESHKIGVRRRKKLEEIIAIGECARDAILDAAMPLIKSLASSEFRRRSHWGSRVDLDDLVQEGCLGFLRGLASYDPTASSVSPSHYLGQWVVTEIRRSAERADNDMAIPTAKSQQWRKIRAIRARLRRELNREPTDEEIITASGQVYSRIGPKLGAAHGVNDTTAGGTPISQGALDAERDYRLIASTAIRIHENDTDDNDVNGDRVLASRDHEDDTPGDSGRVLMGEVMCSAMDRAGIPAVQQQVILRFHGIHPYETAANISEACAPLGVSPRLGQKVVDAYTELMAKPGGPLHHVVSALSEEACSLAGMGWVSEVLGDITLHAEVETPEILTRTLPQRPTDAPVPSKAGTWGVYCCDVHQQPFMMRFSPREEAKTSWPCPSCNRPSPLQAQKTITTSSKQDPHAPEASQKEAA